MAEVPNREELLPYDARVSLRALSSALSSPSLPLPPSLLVAAIFSTTNCCSLRGLRSLKGLSGIPPTRSLPTLVQNSHPSSKIKDLKASHLKLRDQNEDLAALPHSCSRGARANRNLCRQSYCCSWYVCTDSMSSEFEPDTSQIAWASAGTTPRLSPPAWILPPIVSAQMSTSRKYVTTTRHHKSRPCLIYVP